MFKQTDKCYSSSKMKCIDLYIYTILYTCMNVHLVTTKRGKRQIKSFRYLEDGIFHTFPGNSITSVGRRSKATTIDMSNYRSAD